MVSNRRLDLVLGYAQYIYIYIYIYIYFNNFPQYPLGYCIYDCMTGRAMWGDHPVQGGSIDPDDEAEAKNGNIPCIA